MATINVRRLDNGVVDRLKARASRNNRSLEGEARHILECAADDDMVAKRTAFAETMKRLRPLTEGRRHTPAEVLIREDRDRRTGKPAFPRGVNLASPGVGQVAVALGHDGLLGSTPGLSPPSVRFATSCAT